MTIRQMIIEDAARRLRRNCGAGASLKNYRQNTNMALANARDSASNSDERRAYLARLTYRSKQLLFTAIVKRASGSV